MTVYIDNMFRSPRGKRGDMLLSRMMADTTAELLAMVDKLEISHKWIRNRGAHDEHFTVTLTKRRLAVAHGAEEISMLRFDALCQARKPKERPDGKPDWPPAVEEALTRARRPNRGAISTGR